MYNLNLFIFIMDKILISKRFKEVLTDLKVKKKLRSYEYLAANYNPQAPKDKQFISEMANGRVQPNEEVVKYLAEKYGVSKEYIYEGEGEMYLKSTNGYQQKIQDMDAITEKLLKSYEERIQEHKDTIELLKSSLNRTENHNDVLKSLVQTNLQIVLENQIIHETAMEARQNTILELLAKSPADADQIFENVYRKEAELSLAYDGKDMHLKTGRFYKK